MNYNRKLAQLSLLVLLLECVRRLRCVLIFRTSTIRSKTKNDSLQALIHQGPPTCSLPLSQPIQGLKDDLGMICIGCEQELPGPCKLSRGIDRCDLQERPELNPFAMQELGVILQAPEDLEYLVLQPLLLKDAGGAEPDKRNGEARGCCCRENR